MLCSVFTVPWRWDRAAVKGAEGKYEDAMQQIIAAESIGLPLPPNFMLLKAVLARQLGDPKLALLCTAEARKQIRPYKRYSDAEKKYLECFASHLNVKLARELGESEPHDCVVDFASVDLEKVPGGAKNIFPLREHPAWRK